MRKHHAQTHGHTLNRMKSPTYKSWESMIARCSHPSSAGFAHYKRLGITICERWLTFQNFLDDMGERPAGMTLERRDNRGNYEPENCRWATRREQANNRATNVRFEYRGKSYTLADLARETGAEKETLRVRLIRGKRKWTVEDAVNVPVIPRHLRHRSIR